MEKRYSVHEGIDYIQVNDNTTNDHRRYATVGYRGFADRIVACLNACVGIETKHIEDFIGLGMIEQGVSVQEHIQDLKSRLDEAEERKKYLKDEVSKRILELLGMASKVIGSEEVIAELVEHLKITNCLLELRLNKDDAVDRHYVEEMKKVIVKAEKKGKE